MKVMDVERLPNSPKPHHVDAREAHESPHAVAVVVTLRPGEALKKHTMAVYVFLYALEGIGYVEIGDERTTLGKGMLAESPARVPHRGINESNGLFRAMAVKAPRPAEDTILL